MISFTMLFIIIADSLCPHQQTPKAVPILRYNQEAQLLLAWYIVGCAIKKSISIIKGIEKAKVRSNLTKSKLLLVRDSYFSELLPSKVLLLRLKIKENNKLTSLIVTLYTVRCVHMQWYTWYQSVPLSSCQILLSIIGQQLFWEFLQCKHKCSYY